MSKRTGVTLLAGDGEGVLGGVEGWAAEILGGEDWGGQNGTIRLLLVFQAFGSVDVFLWLSWDWLFFGDGGVFSSLGAGTGPG